MATELRWQSASGSLDLISAPDAGIPQETLTDPLQIALQLHLSGQFEDARSRYQGVLNAQPRHPDALYLLGVLNKDTGRLEPAVELITRAIDIDPRNPAYHNDLADSLCTLKQFDAAFEACERALALQPEFPEALNNLGNVHFGLERLEEAEAAYRQALGARPEFPEALSNLGNICYAKGDLDEAQDCYERALAAKPDYPAALNNLGSTLRVRGHLEKAIECCHKVLALAPGYAGAHNNMGLALAAQGRLDDAIHSLRTAGRLAPGNTEFLHTLLQLLKHARAVSIDDALKRDLLACFSLKNVDYLMLGSVAATTLTVLQGADFESAIATAREAADGAPHAVSSDATFRRLLSDPLLLMALRNSLITSLLIESFLTLCRRTILRHFIEDEGSAPIPTILGTFVIALSRQCFLNEYLYAETQPEAVLKDRLRQIVEETVDPSGERGRFAIALLGCYQPLYTLDNAQALAASGGHAEDEAFSALLACQITEPLTEALLRERIQTIGKIKDEVSKRVRSQYEENPYPRWTSTDINAAKTLRGYFLQTFPKACFAPFPEARHPQILVAGCGTGKHAIFSAHKFNRSRLLAVDLSTASLAYATRKAHEMECSNIEFRQGDILELGCLNKTFDIIECVGVLHHMHDPVAGWRVLTRLLKPGGCMRMGLYSEHARKCVVAARSLVREKGYQPNVEDIRRCREEIVALDDDSLARRVTEFGDFYATSTTRDLIFHVLEHRFTLPAIERILEALSLRFIGFDIDPGVLNEYRARFPDDSACTSLENWDEFERNAPGTFASMYQFWLQKIGGQVKATCDPTLHSRGQHEA